MKREKVKKLFVVVLCLVMGMSLTACSKNNPDSGTGTSTKTSTSTITYDKLRSTAKLKNVKVHDEISGKTTTINGTVSVQSWGKTQIIISYKSTTYTIAVETSDDGKNITMVYTGEKYKLKKK